MVLCVGVPTTKITVEADTRSRRTVRRNCEHGGGSFDSPDRRKVVPLNKTVRTSTEERREDLLFARWKEDERPI